MKFFCNVMSALVIGAPLMGFQTQASAADGTDQTTAAVWPAGPLELVMAFSAGVDSRWANSLTGKPIAYFDPARGTAADSSVAAPLGTLRIAGVKLDDEGRTLLLATDPHPRIARYELVLGPPPGKVVSYDLSGVEATWTAGNDDAGAEPAWKGWWPDLDVDATQRLTRGSAPHEKAFALLKQPGRLTLSTLLSLPPDECSVRIDSSGAISDVTLGDEQPVADPKPVQDGLHSVLVFARPRNSAVFLSFVVETGKNDRPLKIHALFAPGKSDKFREIERQRFTVSWAPIPPASAAPVGLPEPDLAGGDAKRGETLFFSEQARCSQCHAFRGRGGSIGPDLTEVSRKGKDHVYRSIAAPSTEIIPEYVPYTVATRDGRVYAGVVRAEGTDAIRVTDTNAKTATLRRDEIDQIRPSGTSIMPVGLAGGLGETGLRDLIAYLMSTR